MVQMQNMGPQITLIYHSNFIIKETAQNLMLQEKKKRIGIVADLRYGCEDLALT